MYNDSQAVASPGWLGLSSSKATNACRASTSLCQPRLSSGSPAHVRRVPSIHDPVPMVSISGNSGSVAKNSLGVVVTIVGCDASLEYHSCMNGRALSWCWNSDMNIQFSPSSATVSKCSDGSSPASSNSCLMLSRYAMKSETAASGVIVPYWNAILSEMTLSLNTVAISPPSSPVTIHGVAKLLATSTSMKFPFTSVDFIRISSSVTIH